MKVLIFGGRDFTDAAALDAAMVLLPFKVTAVIHGDSRGADTLGKLWAMARGIQPIAVPALWDFHGRGAGHRRNQVMIDLCQPDYAVGLPGGTGTADMQKRLVRAGIPLYLPYSTSLD